MGNVADRGHEESHDWPFADKDSESNFDTIDRDFKYKDFGRSDRTPVTHSSGKERSSGRKKSVSRSGSGRRRASFKAKQSFKGMLTRRSSSVKSKDRSKGSAILLADMEVKVDGKVAKLVLRNSVLRRRAESGVNSHNSPVLTTVNTATSTRTPDDISENKQTASKYSGYGIGKQVPKDSMKIQSTKELRLSPGQQLEKRNSYEAAMTGSHTSSLPADEATTTASPTVTVVTRKNNNDKSKVNSKNRWSDIDFSPKKLIFNHHKQRPKSTYVNVNNNNTSITGQSTPGAVTECDGKYKRKSAIVNQDLSNDLSKLVVSPITDV